MTKQTRRKFSPEFKAKVALEAAKEQVTLALLSQKFEVNAVTISKWKSGNPLIAIFLISNLLNL